MHDSEGQEWEALAQMVEHFREHGIGHQAGGWWVEEAGQGGGPVHGPKIRNVVLTINILHLQGGSCFVR